jgi:hypothetical protein
MPSDRRSTWLPSGAAIADFHETTLMDFATAAYQR